MLFRSAAVTLVINVASVPVNVVPDTAPFDAKAFTVAVPLALIVPVFKAAVVKLVVNVPVTLSIELLLTNEATVAVPLAFIAPTAKLLAVSFVVNTPSPAVIAVADILPETLPDILPVTLPVTLPIKF